jgi:hypothetical protein
MCYFQALSCTWEATAKEIVTILLQHDQMVNSFIGAVSSCESYDDGNILAEVLSDIKELSEEQASRLENAYNDSSQLRGSYGFNGNKPNRYGDGLAYHLKRLTVRKWVLARQ